jgi:hypothetical protein
MARVHHVVHTLRQKPQHVRENIAIGASLGITLLVAVSWLGVNAARGTFALAPSTFAPGVIASDEAIASTKDNVSDLLGAAGSAFAPPSSGPSIEIVDTQVHSTLDQGTVPSDLTVIHF